MKLIKGNIKTRFYLLLAGIPIVLTICWQLAFSQTFQSIHKLSTLRNSTSKYENTEQILMDLKIEIESLKEFEIPDPEEVDEVLLEIISKNVNKYGIVLEEFPEIHEETSSNYSIQTYKLTFSGRFISLLKFTDFLESEFKSGQLISVDFLRTDDRRSGEKLFMNIYYQLIFKKQ